MSDEQQNGQIKAEKTWKRDHLIEIEQKVQTKWLNEQIFQADAPPNFIPDNDESQPEKYMATFPYPYMNGRLHLGHAFTLIKTDFQTNFQRLLGKQVLFPFAFHCTGMPIKASADRLVEEIKQFGCPPCFPEDQEDVENEVDDQVEDTDQQQNEVEKHQVKPKTRSKKSKLVAKTGGAKRQWKIMASSGVPEDLIPKFADPRFWLEYFPPLAQADLTRFGCGIDFRRSFLTTDVNPYYDSFTRWQFRQLEKKGFLKFGKRESIYSPKDGQICADHDRSSGEGVGPQEYTLIKLEVVWEDLVANCDEENVIAKWVKPGQKKIKLFLLAATLRPETMFGQTNCWILPEGEYGVYEIESLTGEVYVLGHQAARNLSFQDRGKIELRQTVKGSDLIGLPLRAPLTKYSRIHLLPMNSISMKKGTGIVTSVPSDAPHDYINLKMLQEKPALRQKLGLADEWVLPYQVVPIMETNKYGRFSAEKACEEFKIQSPKEVMKLATAKDEVYKAGFYDGVFLNESELPGIGQFGGQRVEEVKEQIKVQMLEANQALKYWEPAGTVISRSGDECVVALTDQWYLDYSQPEWKKLVADYIQNELECYQPELKEQLLYYADWIQLWGCSRSFGLGTRLPQDEQYLIESLSDSTIYMAYYTVAHLLQDGNIHPKLVRVGSAGITPEMMEDPEMADQIWNWIFTNGQMPSGELGILSETWELLRREFQFWYPWDLRVSGKDLAYNHLPFSLYNHCAIFEKKYWPKSIKCGGFLMINGQKMSKSEGNFLTLEQAIDEYSAMAVRMTLADSGDGMEMANFVRDEANKMILRLYTQLEWMEEMLKKIKSDESDVKSDTRDMDEIFEHQIRRAICETKIHYEQLNYAQVLKNGFFDLQNDRDRYVLWVGEDNVNLRLIRRFIEVQALLMAPIVPQWSDYIWRELLGHQQSILVTGRWPVCDEPDRLVLMKAEYLAENCHRFHQKREYFLKRQKTTPIRATIYVSENYADWQRAVIEILKDLYIVDDGGVKTPDKKDVIQAYCQNELLKPHIGKKPKKPVMAFSALLQTEVKEGKPLAEVFCTQSLLPEQQLWQDSLDLIRKQLMVEELTVKMSDDPEDGRQGQPMKPIIVYE